MEAGRAACLGNSVDEKFLGPVHKSCFCLAERNWTKAQKKQGA